MTIRDRLCDVCGRHLPTDPVERERLGVESIYHAFLKKLFCRTCLDMIKPFEKDYSRSTRGRHRTRGEMDQIILKLAEKQ